ncbi:MAG: DUF2064 domain-containing protein [Nonlabens sp.]
MNTKVLNHFLNRELGLEFVLYFRAVILPDFKQPNLNSTAVMIFARSGEKDAANKNLTNTGALFDELTKHTIHTVKQTGLPYFLVDETLQEGSNFGQRYTNAIKRVFQLGFDNVITVGNDTPQLSVQHLNSAVQNLTQGDSTVGPSQDGGFYLLGLSSSAFAKATEKEFLKIKWQSSQTKEDLLSLLSKNGDHPILLEVLIDIDTKTDARVILKESLELPKTIIQLLLLAIKSSVPCNSKPQHCYDEAFIFLPLNKGSPRVSYPFSY